jgi:hypothetical protein
MTPPPREFAGLTADGIDWSSRKKRWVCESCRGMRRLPLALSYYCHCTEPPTRLVLGILTKATQEMLDRLARYANSKTDR